MFDDNLCHKTCLTPPVCDSPHYYREGALSPAWSPEQCCPGLQGPGLSRQIVVRSWVGIRLNQKTSMKKNHSLYLRIRLGITGATPRIYVREESDGRAVVFIPHNFRTILLTVDKHSPSKKLTVKNKPESTLIYSCSQQETKHG